MKSLRIYLAELQTAAGFLTVLPVMSRIEPRVTPAETEGQSPSWELGESAGWFPWVGLVVGAAAAVTWWLAGLVLPPLLAAVLAATAWVTVTGGLHLDGLADCCDGFFSPAVKERRLEILHDPRLGVFGTVGLFLALALKIAALSSLEFPGGIYAFLLAASASRGLILLSYRQPLARSEGMGRDFHAGLGGASFVLAAFPPIGLAILLGWHGLGAIVASLLAGIGIYALARRRIGGVTGDVLGFAVEAGELAVLAACSFKFPT